MLLGKDFCRRHNRGLFATGNCRQRRKRRHNGFAGTHIALHQPQHGNRLGQIGGNFIHYTALGAGQLKPQLHQKARLQTLIQIQASSAIGLGFAAQQQQTQMMGEQFFKRQALLVGMFTVHQLLDIGMSRWLVQVAQYISQ